MNEIRKGSSFDNRRKETKEALGWFKANLYIGKFKCHTAAMIARKLFDQHNGFSARHGEQERVY